MDTPTSIHTHADATLDKVEKGAPVVERAPQGLLLLDVVVLQRLEWAGQTAASLFWIISVFFYGISSTGDALQLCAASCWFVANLAHSLQRPPPPSPPPQGKTPSV